MVCQACYQQGSDGGKFCSGCGQPLVNPMYSAQPRFMRARYGKIFGGVCAGIAQYYGWDPTIVRLAIIAIVLCGFGSPIVAYLIAWMVVPMQPFAYTAAAYVPPAGPQPAA